MERKRDEIIKALECCTYGGDITKSQVEVCSPCPYFNEGNCTDMLKENALALITSQEQRIKELTEENEAWQKQLISKEEQADKAYYDLACEVENLRAENENLHASCTEFERKCASLNDENERLKATKYMAYSDGRIEMLPTIESVKAKTVWQMQERLKEKLDHYPQRCGDCFKEKVDQIAKEMLEGK